MERSNKTNRDAARSSMMPLRRAEFLKLLGGAAFGLAYAVGGTTAALAEGGTLTVGISSDIKTLDPHLSSLDVFRHTIRSTVFEALTFIDPDTLQPVPALAASWEVAPDNLSVTFKLQDGVKWHDGSAFTAGDVVFTLKRVMDPKTASVLAPQVASVADVTAVDPGTVRVTLKATTPGILANLATVQIVNPKNIDAITTKPIGTGPFKFAEYKPDSHVKLVRNDDYKPNPAYKERDGFAGAKIAYVDSVTFRFMPEAGARDAALAAGQVHLNETSDGPTANDDMNNKKDRGNSVRILRYGVKSRAYGVN